MTNTPRKPLALVVTLAAAGTLALSTFASPGGHGHAPEPAAKPQPTTAPAADAASVPADVALKRLVDGNERFVAGVSARPNQTQARLCDTFANGQHPYAAVLSCADSRVPPELVFDAGIGDLFVVRVAGNVSDVDEVGTLEYGVEHLGINLVAVVGHLKCGAVTAVVEKARVTRNIELLVDNITPAAETARRQFPQLSGGRLVEKAIRANVRQSIADLSAKSELLRERIKSGKLKVVGGVYNLHTGEVDWLEQADPAATPVAGPAAVDEHSHPTAAPAKGGHDDVGHGNGAHGDAGHGTAGHAPAAAGHAAPPADDPAHADKPHNYLALGGLVGAGAVVSFGVLHFAYGRRANATASAAEPAAAAPTTPAPTASGATAHA